MAVSAFRSTTKRSQVGSDGVAGTPSRGRRASSFSEPNSKYFSDSSSMSDPRYGDPRRPRASSRRHSIDSESDADGVSKHYQSRSSRRSRDGSESDGSAYRSLRRTSSQSDFSKQRIRRGSLFSDKEASGDEMHVEERTIRAVHAQMKQIRNKNPTEEFDVIGLYDAMKAEVKQAISDLKHEIQQERRTPMDDTVNIRKEYAEQLEESERRANNLWTELADEEQRCMDLAKIVKDMLPDSKGVVNKRAYGSKRYVNQRQMVSESLDEDARKFFEECVPVSHLDCRKEDPFDADRDMSMSEHSSVISSEFTEPEGVKVTPLDQDPVTSAPEQTKTWDQDNLSISRNHLKNEQEKNQNAIQPQPSEKQREQQSSSTTKAVPPELKFDDLVVSSKYQTSDSDSSTTYRTCRQTRAPVNVDGVVMPWLEWETGSESSQRSRERRKHRVHGSPRSSGSQETVAISPGDIFASSGSSSITSRPDAEQLFWDSLDLNEAMLGPEIDEVLPQRMKFKDRIVAGRMHVCMGVF